MDTFKCESLSRNVFKCETATEMKPSQGFNEITPKHNHPWVFYKTNTPNETSSKQNSPK